MYLFVHHGGGAHATTQMWRSEDNLLGLVFSFHQLDPGALAQAKLYSRCSYSPSHVPGLTAFLCDAESPR